MVKIRESSSPAEAFADVGPLHGTLTETAYLLPDDLPFDEWASEAPVLVTMAQSSMWWLGDYLRFGEHRYGEKYVQAVEATGYAVSTLKNAQWVAERIPPGERRTDVPFSHHRAVASLDAKPRREILAAAAESQMTEYEVREKVREVKAADAVPPPADAPAPPRSLSEAHRDALAALDRVLAAGDLGQAHAAARDARVFMVEAQALAP